VLEAKSGKRDDREQHDPMLYQKLRHRYSFSLVSGMFRFVTAFHPCANDHEPRSLIGSK
jgi:hypothetical protein